MNDAHSEDVVFLEAEVEALRAENEKMRSLLKEMLGDCSTYWDEAIQEAIGEEG